MKYEKDPAHNDLLVWWLSLRFIVLPLLVLVPFFLIKYTGANCFSNSSTISGLHLHGGPIWFSALLWIVLIAFLLLSFMQIGSRKARVRHTIVIRQLIVAGASTTITLPLYVIMWQYSQAKHLPSWFCDNHNQLHSTIPSGAHFGLGLDPGIVTIIIGLYLLMPLITYFATQSTNRRVGGHKKQDLFQ